MVLSVVLHIQHNIDNVFEAIIYLQLHNLEENMKPLLTFPLAINTLFHNFLCIVLKIFLCIVSITVLCHIVFVEYSVVTGKTHCACIYELVGGSG